MGVENMKFVKIERPTCYMRDEVENEVIEDMNIKTIKKPDKHIIKFYSKRKIKHIIHYYPKTKKFYDTNFRGKGKGKFVKYYLSGWVMGYLTIDKESIYHIEGELGKYKFYKPVIVNKELGTLRVDKLKARIIFHDKTRTYFKQIRYYDGNLCDNWIDMPLIPMKMIK
jgi:hypothetical protein